MYLNSENKLLWIAKQHRVTRSIHVVKFSAIIHHCELRSISERKHTPVTHKRVQKPQEISLNAKDIVTIRMRRALGQSKVNIVWFGFNASPILHSLQTEIFWLRLPWVFRNCQSEWIFKTHVRFLEWIFESTRQILLLRFRFNFPAPPQKPAVTPQNDHDFNSSDWIRDPVNRRKLPQKASREKGKIEFGTVLRSPQVPQSTIFKSYS